MKIDYNVTHATFFQAVIVVILSAVNAGYAGITSCFGADKADCATNSILAIALVILAIIWFGFLSALAYAAWIRRTVSIILIFIMLELIVAFVIYAFNIRHYETMLGLVTSIIDLTLTIWVLFTSFRLLKLRGTKPTPIQGRKHSKLNQHRS